MNRTVFSEYPFPLNRVLSFRPDAAALVLGSDAYPGIRGIVRFYQTRSGVVVSAQITGLPIGESLCGDRIFGFHIHEGSACEGDATDPFAATGMHYNPDNCEHPYHAGDLPPLFGNNGLAVSVFLTDRFTVNEIIEKAIIIHDQRDDFTTNPSGDAGTKIACGIIRRDFENAKWF